MINEYSKNLDTDTETRLTIASNILNIFAMFSWMIANCLVMVIFVKYGKPLENDWEKLIQKKLFDIFDNQTNPLQVSEEI